MGEKARITLPESLLRLEADQRNQIIGVLKEAAKLPPVLELPKAEQDEHNMWERNAIPLMADVEDGFYTALAHDELGRFIRLMVGLGLPITPEDLNKALEPEYRAYEDELIKAKDSGRNNMTKLIKKLASEAKKKVKQFFEWAEGEGGPLSKRDRKTIKELIEEDLPDYEKMVEDYMTRAAYVGKIRNQAERDGFEVMGAIVDGFPSTLKAARKDDVELTARHAKERAVKEKKVIKVRPLTDDEYRAATHASHHAADKVTEVSERHRAGIRQLVMQAKKERWTAPQLASKLFDTYAEHNRDWRRVAITELAFAASDAYIAGLEEGATVVGMGAVNACKHCKRYVIGKTFTVTHNPPPHDTYEGDMQQVWVGKSNYKRRVIEYRPAIPMHPNCRCRWHRLSKFYKVDDEGVIVLKTTAELINEERASMGLEPDTTIPDMSDPDTLRKLTEKFIAEHGGPEE